MALNQENSAERNESPEAKASEELLELGLVPLIENIRVVLDYKNTPQHPEGYEKIVKNTTYSVREIATEMEERGLDQVIHIEGPSVWDHCKGSMKLVELLNLPEDKKTDLKLIMFFHDLGKTAPGLKDKPENREILKREIKKGKLYQAMKGHAEERLQDVEAGFVANGITGRKLDSFMAIVKNHMRKVAEISDAELVDLFESFGGNDEERKQVAELWAFVMQVDSNSTSSIGPTEDGELRTIKGENRTGLDFDKFWQRYLSAKKKG
jgi:hypothetical protein